MSKPFSRRVRLAVLGAPTDWEPLPGVPETRGDCPSERPCRHVCCSMNLMVMHGFEMPGRRSAVHRYPVGVVRYRAGASGCALDEVDASPDGMTFDEIGERLGCTGRRAEQLVDRALAKLKASGFDAEGWLDALAPARRKR